MKATLLTERTLEIYLNIAENATSSRDFDLAKSMLRAACDHLNEIFQPVGIKILVRIAELLAVHNINEQAESIFTRALRESRTQSTEEWLLARIYDGLSEIHMRQSNLKMARKRCEQALRLIGKQAECGNDLLASRKRKLALINLLQGQPMVAYTLL